VATPVVIGNPVKVKGSTGLVITSTTDGLKERLDVDAKVTGTVAVTATSATGTTTSVASSAANVTLLALNAARKGATVFNDSTKTLYLKLGATASTTSYTTQLGSGSYFEVPFGYTGIIDGLWSSANGSARVTELT
jgi:hypothetical protein